TPQICSSLGQWVDETECEFSCNSGSCIGVCGPGDIQCNGLEVEVCNEQGQWEYSSTCMGGNNGIPICGGAGICGINCDDGYEDCDGDLTCDSLSSPEYCGSCGTNCSSPAGFAPSCENFGGSLSCGTKCPLGYEDCDGNPANGCEVNIFDDETNCGGCDANWHNYFTCSGTCESGICQNGGADNVNDVLFTGEWDNKEVVAIDGDVFYPVTAYREFRVRNFDGERYDTFNLTDKPYYIRNSGPVFTIMTSDELD